MGKQSHFPGGKKATQKDKSFIRHLRYVTSNVAITAMSTRRRQGDLFKDSSRTRTDSFLWLRNMLYLHQILNKINITHIIMSFEVTCMQN